MKLPLLQLPKFSGNVLEWPAFHDTFVTSVDSHKKLSNVQKFTHLGSCLYRRASKCIEGYSVTTDNYSKAFQDLRNRFERKRLLPNELVKSILNLEIPEKTDGKLLRELYDALRNRMRSLESPGLKPDDHPSLSKQSFLVSLRRNGCWSPPSMKLKRKTRRSTLRSYFNFQRVIGRRRAGRITEAQWEER